MSKELSINVYEEQFNDLKKLEKNNEPETIEIDDNAEWKEYHEKILVDWADKALCYRWLHSKSSLKYIRLRNLYTIPVIILSTLTGTANFALERVPEEYQGYCQITIGSINVLSGAHRVSSISWDKFYRNIRVELVKSPEDRTNVTYIIKSCKDEYDRLMETSPNIDSTIINKFNKTFKINNKIDQAKKESLNSLSKPEILDSLESTKNIVYKIDQKTIDKNNAKNKKEQLNKEVVIDDFINTFKKEYSRKPSIIEMYDNLDSKISPSILDKYVASEKWKR